MKHLTSWYSGWLGRRRRWTTGSGEREPVPRSAWEQPLQKIITGICETISKATPSWDNHRYLRNNFTKRQEVYTPNKAMKVQYMFIPTVYIYLRNSIAVSKLKGSLYNVTYEPRFFVNLTRKKRHDHLFSNLCTLNISIRSWGHLLERAE